jgi:hypothetical protein
MGEYHDRKWKRAPHHKVDDWVMHDGINICTKIQFCQLVDQLYGLFQISKVGSNKQWCRLKLPETWKIHRAFDISLLEPYRGNRKDREIPPVEADIEGWIQEAIIASRPINDNHWKHVFLVKWESYTHDENT